MSLKQNVLDLLNNLLGQVQALPEDVTTTDLQAQLDSATASLAAELNKEVALQAKIDAAKAALA